MGSSESTKRLTVQRSDEGEIGGIVTVSERVVRRLRGLEDLPLKHDDGISQDDINNLWQELQQEKTRLKHQHEHFQEYMQHAFDEGRQSESKRLKENRDVLHTKDQNVEEIENKWRKNFEDQDAKSKMKEAKLLEEINSLKEEIAGREGITIEKFNQAFKETKEKFSQPMKVPACQHLKDEVLNCYKQNPRHALNCSQQVQDFLHCVEVLQTASQQSKS
ncbi:MICOS complex subunit Mic19-like [Acropora millepora]|uniref:MICOS complex subunit Mic19-like n=1 Tax=Acropora millepora TaxID=45264 RepID=UPI0010FC76D2|nr:MICOS complex subunit Mic19-like [Acropora millepora]